MMIVRLHCVKQNPFQAVTILDLSGLGALAKSFQYALSCIRAKFGAHTTIKTAFFGQWPYWNWRIKRSRYNVSHDQLS